MKQLVEFEFPNVSAHQHQAAIAGTGEPVKEDTVHDLQFVSDSRGMTKFRSRKTGIVYYQAPGMVWYVEG